MDNYKVGELVQPPYFDGVYPEGLQKKAFDDPFNSAEYVESCRKQARALGMVRSNFLTKGSRSRIEKALFYLHRPLIAARHLVAGCACPTYLLPVAQMIRDLAMRNGRVRVLDIGGGYGDNFFNLLQVLPSETVSVIEYAVIDNPRVCELGRELFSRYTVKPVFKPENGVADLVILVGTLQYIDGWRQFLGNLRGQSVYIARTPIALRTASFTTEQMICPEGRYAGTTRINVIGLEDLHGVLGKPCFEYMAEDYSQQFARLPAPWNDVRYFHMGYAVQS